MSLAVGVISVSLSGCSTAQIGSPEPTAIVTPTPTEDASWMPTYINVAELEGKQVDLKVGEFVEVDTKRDANPNTWMPASSDEKVATVRRGSLNGFGAPVVEAKGKGSATITLNNSTTGQIVTFAVKVK